MSNAMTAPTAQEILAAKLSRFINSHDGCQCVTIDPGAETLAVRSLVPGGNNEETIPATLEDVRAWLGY